MIGRDELERRARLAARLTDTMRECEDTLDQLLSVREVPLAVPSGFFRTSVAPSPFEVTPRVPPKADGNRGPNELSFSVAERIRDERERLGMTQRDLAEKTGIKRPNIARLESGKGLPNLATLLKIANGLEVSISTLLA